MVVDVGANVDCEPQMLAQFGLMGEIYSRLVLKVKQPRVGLLSIGEEEHKGNTLTRETTPLLKIMASTSSATWKGAIIFTGLCGRDRLRWLRRQCRAEGERRPGRDDPHDAARIAGGHAFA